MNTFEQAQNNMKKKNLDTIENMERIRKALEKNNLTDDERDDINNIIDNCQKNIDNLEEVTIDQINVETNDLIEKIQRYFRWNPIEYYQNFESFIAKNILGLKEDENGTMKVINSYPVLNININDLMCFKGLNPLYDVVVDSFIKTINDNCGTNIPLSGIEEKILNKYKISNSPFASDPVLARTLIHLREIQRAQDALRNGILYYSFITSDEYQEDESKCLSKGI